MTNAQALDEIRRIAGEALSRGPCSYYAKLDDIHNITIRVAKARMKEEGKCQKS